MSVHLASGLRIECPQCHRLQQVDREVTDGMLPVILRCGFADCKFSMLMSDPENPPKFPKVDPINVSKGTWQLELQKGQVKDYWNRQIGEPVSFMKRCDLIATHLAGGLQTIASLKQDLTDLSDAMIGQFEAEWGFHQQFLRHWNPGKVGSLVKQPWLALPVPCQDELVKLRTRLFIHPDFFTARVGIPLGKLAGGYSAQLMTPYGQTIFPVETWLGGLLDYPPALKLHVLGDRLLGRDLVYCWNDIPGTEPDPESPVAHSPDAPAIRIGRHPCEQQAARQWLARAGVNPWGVGELVKSTDLNQIEQMECYPNAWEYFTASANVPIAHKEIWPAFCKFGRLALCYQNPIEAWNLALGLGAYLFGRKLVVLHGEQNDNNIDALKSLYHHVGSEIKANTSFHWKVFRTESDLQGIPWSALNYIVVQYHPNLPEALWSTLYGYKKRLIVLLDEPLLDILEDNWEASRLFGLVSGTQHWPPLPCTRAPFEYQQGQEALMAMVLRHWKELA